MVFETIDADGDGAITTHELSGFFTHRLWGRELGKIGTMRKASDDA